MMARFGIWLAMVALAWFGCWLIFNAGYKHGQSDERVIWLEAESLRAKQHAEALAEATKKQAALIDRASTIERESNIEIETLNDRVVSLLGQLRERKERAAAANGNSVPTATSVAQPEQSCSGAQLYREDAEFLAGEAARADTTAIALKQCYAQYEAVAKTLAPVASMAD